MPDDLEQQLLARILVAKLPPEEPISRWWRWADSQPTHRLRRNSCASALVITPC